MVMGCGAGSGDHAMDIARMAALDAGWSLDAPGVTLNRFCGSGQQAVNFAAMGVLAGFQDLVVGGGVESMSRPAPLHVDGFTANNDHLRDQYNMVAQGISADLIASVEGFTRERVRRARRRQPEPGAEVAIAEGRFDQVARADLQRRRHPRPRPRRVPPPGHHAGGPGQAATPASRRWAPPSSPGSRAHRRPDGAAGLPAPRARSATCTTPATPRAWSTAPPRCWWSSPDYARAHGMTPRAKIVMTRGRRYRARHHADRARAGRHPLRGEGRHDLRRHRSHRGERGLRRRSC